MENVTVVLGLTRTWNHYLSIKLCATNLRTRAKQKQKIVHCHGQFNIDCDNIALAFESFKVSKPVLRLTTVEGTNILC